MVVPVCPICEAQDWDRGYIDTSGDFTKGAVIGVITHLLIRSLLHRV